MHAKKEEEEEEAKEKRNSPAAGAGFPKVSSRLTLP